MAKKNSAKRKSDASGVKVCHGGVTFKVKKSKTHFAVKKSVGAEFGKLSAARAEDAAFSHLLLNQGNSTRDVEVYSVDADCLDSAMDRLRSVGTDVDWCGHVYHSQGDPTGLMIPRDTIYVETEPDTDPAVINSLLDQYGLEFVSQDHDLPNAFVWRLTSAAKLNPIKVSNSLLEAEEITVAEPDFATAISYKAHRPSDPLFVDQWHLENLGGIGLTSGADVSAPEAWDITRGDRSIVVCIMDDGVDLDHDDFSSAGKIVAPRDFGQDDLDPSPVRNGRGPRGDNHGTACAGVAVADENNIGTVGIAPNCALMPVRTSGMISNDTIEALFDHARINDADVISCSWGVARKFFPLTTKMKNVIAKAAREGRDGKGCVILFAAGNEDSPVDGFDSVGDRVLAGFAKHDDVMAIAASTSNDVRSHYSNFGPEIWVSAPSSGRGGRGILTTDRSGDVGYELGDYTINDPFGGTSSATPLAAGICGLILSLNPNLTATQVREILKESADKIDRTGGNYNAQGHSDLYGFGRVNAMSAVELTRQGLTTTVVRTRTFERSPNQAIPDNNQIGISDSISVSESGEVETIEVSVEIGHTFRGDLEVALLGPNRNRVLLHNRDGGRADDVVATYTLENRPGLSQLTRMSAAGDWTLQVRDLARIDTGTLHQWSLTLGISGNPQSEWETSPGLVIPDNDAQGISSSLEVDGVGLLRDIEVTLDITHTFRGDLRVDLESPGGRQVRLHDRVGHSQDHLRRTYRVADTSALSELTTNNIEINGTWKLLVSDRARFDVGKLNSWKLKLTT